MNPWTTLLLAFVLLFLSAIFSGSETGLYSISRVRLEAEAEEGKRSARRVARLLRDDAGLLITLLVGNNLVLELLTHLTDSGLQAGFEVPGFAKEILVAAILTPAVFLLGELVPKDLFRRQAHTLLGVLAPFLELFRWVAAPIAWPLALLARGLEALFGLRQEDFTRVLRRDEMLEVLAESRRTGALTPHAEQLANNVLVLRHTPLSRVAVPWARVRTVDLGLEPAAVRSAVLEAGFTRLPAVGRGPAGERRVLGYLHQIDVMAVGPEVEPRECLRPLLELPPDMPLDRAVARMQNSGNRLAIVGTAAAPAGLVSLMDLLATIAAQPRFSQPGAAARIGAPS